MSRRPASFTQADVYRAACAAKRLGPEWRVEIERGVIRVISSPWRPLRRRGQGTKVTTKPIQLTTTRGLSFD